MSDYNKRISVAGASVEFLSCTKSLAMTDDERWDDGASSRRVLYGHGAPEARIKGWEWQRIGSIVPVGGDIQMSAVEVKDGKFMARNLGLDEFPSLAALILAADRKWHNDPMVKQRVAMQESNPESLGLGR